MRKIKAMRKIITIKKIGHSPEITTNAIKITHQSAGGTYSRELSTIDPAQRDVETQVLPIPESAGPAASAAKSSEIRLLVLK